MTKTVDFNATETIINETGDAIAHMLDQLIKGNWVDDTGHPVKMNAAMIAVKDQLKKMIEFRHEHMGYDFVDIPASMMKGPVS